MTDLIGKAVNGVIECVDVDGVVRRVDLDDALQRIDINKLLDRVDWDSQLDRIDFDRVMRRVDVNEIVLRSNVGAIVAHSTTGIFTELLDALRTQVILMDLWIFNVFGWIRRRDLSLLPPSPSGEDREKPGGWSETAIAIQGCFTGIVSKGIAIFIDSMVVTFSFAVLLIIVEMCWMFLMDNDSKQEVDRDSLWAVIAYCTYWFLYFLIFCLLTGKTIGMAIVGIKVVDKKSSRRVTFKQALIRTALLPLSTAGPFLVVIGLIRRDGRMLHDLAAGAGLIYRWNAEMAQLREKSEQQNAETQTRQSLDTPLLSSMDDETSYNSFHNVSGSGEAV